MRSRNLLPHIEELALRHNKMVFISGPRQSGKTTLAKSLLGAEVNYFNWDHLPFRKKWLQSMDKIAEELLSQKNPRIVLDEFHKNRRWRNELKGFFDQYGQHIQIILTGSARLNTFRRGADSLLGRFFHFHLLPFTLGELVGKSPRTFLELKKFIEAPKGLVLSKETNSVLGALFDFGGFPEPFEKKSKEFQRVWSKNRVELLIRQDLKDLSNIIDIGHVELLASFLPERVGSPLSVQSLREDLDVAHTTVTRWLNALSLVYYQFDIRPYSKSIPRSLKREPKIYLYDWSEIESRGPRFENMVACHLLKMIHYYNDTGQADLKLHYLRDKEGNEVDFLVTNKAKPFFTIEVKLNERNLDSTFRRFSHKLKVPHFQIIQDQNFFRKYGEGEFAMSFDHFFERLP